MNEIKYEWQEINSKEDFFKAFGNCKIEFKIDTQVGYFKNSITFEELYQFVKERLEMEGCITTDDINSDEPIGEKYIWCE